MKTTTHEAKRSSDDHDATHGDDAAPQARFSLPDLTKKPVGLRVRSHVKGGALKCGGDPETM